MAKKRNALGMNVSNLDLGGGISAIINMDDAKTSGSLSMNEIEISKIEANANNPRTEFDEEKLSELADSIRAHGIIVPITLRKISEDKYQIISGERRFRASKLVGLTSIPAYIRNVDDEKDVEEMALIENIQRTDLNAIEIALSFRNLSEKYNQTQEELSKKVGKKRETISNYLRLLKLPANIQVALKNKTLDMGHARALLAINDPVKQIEVFDLIVKEKLSVREVEEIARKMKDGAIAEQKRTRKNNDAVNEEYDVLRKELSSYFKKQVQLKVNGKGKGAITIPFSNTEELEDIMAILDKLKQ